MMAPEFNEDDHLSFVYQGDKHLGAQSYAIKREGNRVVLEGPYVDVGSTTPGQEKLIQETKSTNQ